MAFRQMAAIVVVVVTFAGGVWYLTNPDDGGAAIRQRLRAFSDEVNDSRTDRRGPEAHTAELGLYLTEDIEVDLGKGSAPIRGRDTVVGMAGRLQPRTAAFKLKFEDVSVALDPGRDTAAVHLTAEFIRRSITTDDQSLDAREFALDMRREDGVWRISRVTAVDTLK